MTTDKSTINSTELGTLWIIYTVKSAELLMYDLFKNKSIDKEVLSILTGAITDGQNIMNDIGNIFNNENVVIPIGFNKCDIVSEAPLLFDDIFHIMFFRNMMKLNFAYTGVFSAVSYRKEVNDLLNLYYNISNKYYMMATNYLLGKGALSTPPYVTMPKQVEFIENKNYMSGFNIFSDKRSLNTIEVGYIYESIEFSFFNMHLFTGFAQVATESEVKKYFTEGKELTKKHIAGLSDILLQNDIQPPGTWTGKVTDSTQACLSDKLMMYVVGLLSSTPLGFTALGTSFCMRSDLPFKLALNSKGRFDYAKKGSKIMIEHKWMEEPPQMEDRNQLAKPKE